MKRWISRRATMILILSLVVLLSFVVITLKWWSFLIEGDTPTNVFRNMAFIAAGFIALLFAYWRSSIAETQAELTDKQTELSNEQGELAKKEYFHSRFQRSIELLSRAGIHNSYARVAGFHNMRFLVYDEPELGIEICQVLIYFMIQTPVDGNYDAREFNMARASAEFVIDTIERQKNLAVMYLIVVFSKSCLSFVIDQ